MRTTCFTEIIGHHSSTKHEHISTVFVIILRLHVKRVYGDVQLEIYVEDLT